MDKRYEEWTMKEKVLDFILGTVSTFVIFGGLAFIGAWVYR